MQQEFVATFTRTVEDTVRVKIPEGIEWQQSFGHVYIYDPANPNIMLSLEVAARRGLVSVERLNP